MIKAKDHFHGSDLEKIEQAYGIQSKDVTSFSANVNPLGISPKLRQTLCDRIDAITSYPDREYTSLRTSIGTYTNLPKEDIIVGNGVTELISLFMQITTPQKALLVNPTYSEYERELQLVHGTLEAFYLKEENNFEINLEELTKALSKDLDLLILCNPNNPTSSILSVDMLRQLLITCKQHEIFVLVDETYIEFVDDLFSYSAISLVEEFNNIIVLRGVSKFFAAPGIRLGYAITNNQSLRKEINARKNPWSINSLAAIAGEIMFSDIDYIKETRTLISKERKRIYEALKQNPYLKVYPPYANFMLVQILLPNKTAFDLFETAIKQGLMIRDCSTFSGLSEQYFRFCFMNPEKNDALLRVIDEFCKKE